MHGYEYTSFCNKLPSTIPAFTLGSLTRSGSGDWGSRGGLGVTRELSQLAVVCSSRLRPLHGDRDRGQIVLAGRQNGHPVQGSADGRHIVSWTQRFITLSGLDMNNWPSYVQTSVTQGIRSRTLAYSLYCTRII